MSSCSGFGAALFVVAVGLALVPRAVAWRTPPAPTRARADGRWKVAAKKLQRASVASEGDVLSTTTNARLLFLRLEDGTTHDSAGLPIRGVFKAYHTSGNEIAAYVLSHAAGFDLVPPTVPFTYKGRAGSLQLWVEGEKNADTNKPNHAGVNPDRLILMHAFDQLIVNSDRHGGNYEYERVDGEKELVALDHSHTTFDGAVTPYSAFRGRLKLASYELSEHNRQVFARINIAKVARAMVESGFEDRRTSIVLQKIENIRRAYPPAGQVPAGKDGVLPPDVIESVAKLVALAHLPLEANAPASNEVKNEANHEAPHPLAAISNPYRPGAPVPPPGALLQANHHDQPHAHLSEQQYRDIADGAMELLDRFPPNETHYLGLGRSSGAIIGFLENLGPNVASYLPSDGLGREGAADAVYFEYFKRFIPSDVLEQKRKLVVFHRSESGHSIANLAPILQRYLHSIGSPIVVQGVGFAAAPLPNGYPHIDTGRYPELAQLSNDRYKAVSPYSFHQIGKTPLAKLAVNPNYALFKQSMLRRMQADAKLGEFLAKRFNVPAGP